MNVPLYIARRYLFSKKSHNAINIISTISVCGVVVATIALVCALSVFNGFNSTVALLFSNFDPQLKITPASGKVFSPGLPAIQQLRSLPEIDVFCEVLQENASIRYSGRQVIAVIKGVEQNYGELAHIDSVMLDGRFALREDIVDYATMGVVLASSLGIRAGFVSPMEIYAPKRNVNVNMANPASSFNKEYAYLAGVFATNHQEYDEMYAIVPLSLARELFGYDDEVTSIELKLKPGASTESIKRQIRNILGDEFVVKDRYEQQEASFQMMQIEKWITYLILIFILTIAIFNIVGSLSMLMIEKKDDAKTLRNLGADDTFIRKIFLFEGWLISGSGAVVGICIGLILCYIQKTFKLITLGDITGAFIIDAYPVEVIFSDILMILATVLIIGFLASWYAVRHLGDRWIRQ